MRTNLSALSVDKTPPPLANPPAPMLPYAPRGEPMNLILTQQPGMSESEIEIRYTDLDDKLKNLITFIEKGEHYILCTDTDTGSKHRVFISDIFYIEIVERKTFLYTKSEVFRCKMKFNELLDMLQPYGFVQANRHCIINIDVLDSIDMMSYSKAEAILENGEKIIVSRTYIQDINTAFEKGMGDI